MNKLTTFGKIAVTVAIIGALVGAKWLIMDSGLIMKKKVKQSEEIGKIDLPTAPANASSTVSAVEMPSDNPANINSKEVRALIWAWNSQMGLMFANGGANTTEGSLMAKQGVNLHLTRQDDVSQMQASLIKFAKEYKDNPDTKEGAQFVAIMGDGSAAFLAGVNPELEKLGKDYRAQVIYSCGKSQGEDKLMGPPSWKLNPQNAKGSTVTAYLRDGDWNIAVKWCADNGIKVNPDEKTYDPDAMNFINPESYIDASQKYISGYTEERAVVKNGKATGEKKTVRVDGVATWTPGDVMIAEKKGGLVSIVSTKEYRSQMPNVLIGIKKFCEDNRDVIEKMITAVGQGGDQVKSYSSALNKAGEISAKVYGEEDGAYWVKYYNGTVQKDKQGNDVELGGSAVSNLADNAELFGLTPGSTNVFGIVYTTFGNIVKKLYPELMPTYPAVDDILDLSYVKNVIARSGDLAAADKTTFTEGDIKEKVAEKSWNIEFESGSAKLTPKAAKDLELLFNDLIVANNLKVEIHGHTDNAGDPAKNMTLSEQRAFAVKQWLEAKSPNNFPEGRVSVIAHGQTNPVVPNDTPEGKAKNRRVTIVMGK
ncbi:MAG TPA: phosphate ABC transporter substrate-binding/OmpA family protein [Chitinophagales bacterium]|nr:phosphate ABC transporter substrate-binding/OmpA family protein [Chitinophagales bacterium]